MAHPRPARHAGVLALMAFSPLQIHFAQHALIDGIFTFWAVLNRGCCGKSAAAKQPRFLAAFALSLAAMVITKGTPSLFISRCAASSRPNRWAKPRRR